MESKNDDDHQKKLGAFRNDYQNCNAVLGLMRKSWVPIEVARDSAFTPSKLRVCKGKKRKNDKWSPRSMRIIKKT